MMLPMMRNQTMKSWRSAEQWLLGSMVLALAMAAFIWLVLGPAPAAPAYLTAIVLLIASLLASLIMMLRVGTTRRQMEAVLHGRARAEQHAIEALRHSEAQWKEVFEHNPVMYFMVDAAGTVLSVNTFGAAQLGYSVSELLGQSVLKVFPADEQPVAQSNVAICLENIGQTHSWEICKVRKDGSSLWVRENAKAVRRLDNQLIVLIACEDVTERKEAENALRQSEMYLAEAQRLSRTGSFGWHVASGEIVWSEETFRIFGYDKAPSIKLARSFSAFIRMIVRACNRPRPRVQRREGLRAWISIADARRRGQACPRRGACGDGCIRWRRICRGRDGCYRAQASRRELHEAQPNLARVTRVTALGEMAASIAHEVNQPLAAVVTNAAACLRWLDREPANLKEARGTLQSIIKDGNRRAK